MAQLQHWLVTCTKCERPADYHCNTCGDILCPRCKEIHQTSRDTGHHSVVSYSDRVEPGKLSEQCEDHSGEQCQLWCQKCHKSVCNECVTSTDHEGHVLVKVEERLQEQKRTLREEFKNYYEISKLWEDSLQQLQSRIKAYERDSDGLSREISKSADRVCNLVRSIESALQKQLQEMKNTQNGILLDYEKLLLSRIKQQIRDAEDKLRSEDVAVLLRYKAKENEDQGQKPPLRDGPFLPTFTPGKLEVWSLEAMIGNLIMEQEEEETKSKGKAAVHESPVSRAIASHQYSSDLSTSTLSLSPTAAVITTLQTDKSYPSFLACAGSGGLVTTQHGGLLISDYTNSTIQSVTENWDLQTLFKTAWRPWGLCVLHNGYVVVAFRDNGKVVQYSMAGKAVRKLDKSLIHPKSVAQNRVNKHLYICDKSGSPIESPGGLLAFDIMSGKLEYKYTGSDPFTFTPLDVCTDQAGHVIITDWNRIHILDQDGSFLQYMMTKDQGLSRPYCIDIDTDGDAWITEWKHQETSQLKVIMYMH